MKSCLHWLGSGRKVPGGLEWVESCRDGLGGGRMAVFYFTWN